MCLHMCALAVCRDDAERAKSGVKKVKGRVVQIVFANKRPVKDKRAKKGEESGEAETTPTE